MAKSNTKTTKGKAKAHKKQKLSAYEQNRLNNIKRNQERLKSLGLDDAKKQVRNAARGKKSSGKSAVSSKKQQPKPPPKKREKIDRAVKKKIDYSSEPSLGSADPRGAAEKKADKVEKKGRGASGSKGDTETKPRRSPREGKGTRKKEDKVVHRKSTSGSKWKKKGKSSNAPKGTVTRVSQRPVVRRKNSLSVTSAGMLRTAIEGYGPWKEMMKKNHPEVKPRNYRSTYQATLDIDPSVASESQVKKLLLGNRTIDGPGSGRPPAYPKDMTDAFLRHIVEYAKGKELTVEDLYKKQGNTGSAKDSSIIRKKAEAFFGKKKYGYTFISRKEKQKLKDYLGRNARPIITEAIKEVAPVKGEGI